MSTVAQIITWADRYFPNSVSEANKILDLDHLHKELYNKIKRLKYEYSQNGDHTTIADQFTYTKPTDCDFDQIFLIKVSKDLQANIDDDTEWETYEYTDLHSDVSSGTYWGRVSDTAFGLLKDGDPIDTAGYEIRIFYFRTPNTLTATTDTPQLEAQYHNLLEYGLIAMLASQGHNPDTQMADFYQRKFDEEFKWVEKNIAKKDLKGTNLEQLESRW